MAGLVATDHRVVIRVDSSIDIGTGHVMRCLTLANALKAEGILSVFLCRAHKGHLVESIAAQGHEVIALPKPDEAFHTTVGDPSHAEWLGASWKTDAKQTQAALGSRRFAWMIVDHYALDRRWQRAMRPFCERILVMDDLADRSHDCDVLLDPTLGREMSEYKVCIPLKAKALLGPGYALLRPEFAQKRSTSLARREKPRLEQLLINMGGVDNGNATLGILTALRATPLPNGCKICVIMGSQAPWIEEIEASAKSLPWHTDVLIGVDDVASIMSASDLAFGAGGGTSWERCCMGLPTMMLCMAENQIEMARSLSDAGAVQVGRSPEELTDFLSALLNKGDLEGFMVAASTRAAAVTDGKGVSRVIGEMDL
ncbi:UDP-2,4-diacetamido-2,4,6-trideoxy-beta-L-altropyranose hydrolase [Qipengyuania sp. DGS5-3]|uniref:UDP-2,4-diacetamido-2,4, 6-trideoxy-beta-L-altropyranose hydrolase n=1 Tax=Qipengyuania sp. DGS5-3 TaxID=3349632 RepID=UPI0036D27B89